MIKENNNNTSIKKREIFGKNELLLNRVTLFA